MEIYSNGILTTAEKRATRKVAKHERPSIGLSLAMQDWGSLHVMQMKVLIGSPFSCYSAKKGIGRFICR